MPTVEIRFACPGGLADELREMRVWLDQHRCEPSRFLYDLENGEAVIRLDFKITREADAFAARFDGRIVSALDHQGA